MNLTAEQIAQSLDKPRRRGSGKWSACCPAHDDRSPSLSLTDKDGKTLFYCWGGCTQEEVRDALVSRGLWQAASSPRRDWLTDDEIELMQLRVMVYQGALKRGEHEIITNEDRQRYAADCKALTRMGKMPRG